MKTDPLAWLLDSQEPWTRYRTLTDLVDRKPEASEVKTARAQMLSHPMVQDLLVDAASWGERPFKRHNDAGYPIYRLSTLADFGVQANDRKHLPQLAVCIKAVMAHRSAEGAFQSLVNIPKAFGGTGEDSWAWMICDSPTLLYALAAMGLGKDPRVKRAMDHLVGLVEENGWRCLCAPELGKFRGPGRKTDPCPIANVYTLKALSQVPELRDCRAARAGAEMLLSHWESRGKLKMYLFGIGGDFNKLKYPFVWYDILHVADVLNRFPFVHKDPRFLEMVETVCAQADSEGRYTAGSMYQAWKGWSFADKKQPSPWLTFLVLRIQKRLMPGRCRVRPMEGEPNQEANTKPPRAIQHTIRRAEQRATR